MNSIASNPTQGEDTNILGTRIPSVREKALNAGSRIEKDAANESLALAPWFIATLSLPYRDPGSELIAWERENGKYRIIVSPYVEHGKAYYPFGVIPRLLLTWMTTEAIRTGSPEVEISKTLTAFMRQVGIGTGGSQKKRLLDQMQRLFNANIRIESREDTESDGEKVVHKSTVNFQFAEQHDLWLKEENGVATSVEWGSTVTLSPRFFASIKGHSFPVYTEALKALGNSPLRLDVYLFIVHRLYRLKNKTRISWDQLNGQFGGNYKETRMFKRDFLKQLELVKVVYPEARFAVTDKSLMLFKSKHHVPRVPDNPQSLVEAPDSAR